MGAGPGLRMWSWARQRRPPGDPTRSGGDKVQEEVVGWFDRQGSEGSFCCPHPDCFQGKSSGSFPRSQSGVSPSVGQTGAGVPSQGGTICALLGWPYEAQSMVAPDFP